MSRSKRVLSGLTLNYAYQGLLMLVGLWLTPFLLRHIGKHDVGVWVVGTQLVGYLTLLDIGVLGLTPREVAATTGRGEEEKRKALPKLVGQLSTILLFQTLVVALAATLTWFFMPASWLQFKGPIGIILATFTVLFPARIFQAVLEGLQELTYIGRLQIAIWATSTLCTILLVEWGFGLYSLAVGWACTQVLTAASAATRLWIHHRDAIPRRLPRVPRETWFHYLNRGFWLTFSQITQTLLGGLDVIIIGKLYGLEMVVPYACTMKLTTVLTNQPAALMHVAMPGLNELRTSGSREQIFRAITALTQAMLLFSGLIGCVIVAVNQNFVNWWVGTSNFAGLALTIFAVVSMMLRHWNATGTYSIFCYGYERYIAVTMTLDGCCSGILYLVLAKWLGMAGIPLGSILSVALVSLPRNLRVLRKETGMPISQLLRPLWPWFWRFTVLLFLAFMVNIWGGVLSIWTTGAVAVTFGVAYLALMFRPSLDSMLGAYLQPRLQAIGRRLSWVGAMAR